MIKNPELKPFDLIGIAYGSYIYPALFKRMHNGCCQHYTLRTHWSIETLKKDLKIVPQSSQISSAQKADGSVVKITKDYLRENELFNYNEMKKLREKQTDYRLP